MKMMDDREAQTREEHQAAGRYVAPPQMWIRREC